jgi:hypothetical protein
MMDNYSILKSAILNRQQVLADYKGYYREMCPHVIGRKKGVAHCLFYQFGGESSSGAILPGSDSNWRCIPVDQLSIISVRDGEWFSVSGHTRRQTCIDVVDIEVDLIS